MRALKTLLVLSVAGALMVSPATAQTLKKGTMSGTIQTKSATVPATMSGTVFTTSATGFFIVTQWCSEFTAGSLVAGSVALLRTGNAVSGNERCTSYVPGIALPQSTAVMFTNPGSSAQTVTITGVLSPN
jgi:hypothetical protein